MNKLAMLTVHLLLLAPVALSGNRADAATVTIHRDAWGVPHVSGPTDASVVFGYTYAQAQDNFWQIEDTLIQALGRYAEVAGEGGIGADYLNRALRLTHYAQQEYARAEPEARALLKAAARGLNTYIADSGTQPRLIEQFEPWHFLAISRFTQYQLFVFNRARVSNAEISAQADESLLAAHFLDGSRAPIALNAVADAQAQAGSNTWALAPSRTRSGQAFLFINPHQPYFGPGQWHEGHLHSAEGLHFSGAGFFGSPFPTIGHNEHLGWSHTVNEPDIVDVYAITLSADGEQYAYGSEMRTVVRWQDQIRVKVDAGFEQRQFKFARTHHGPIVAMREGQALAVRMAKFAEGGQLMQRYAMLKSTSLAQFKAALARLATPMFNTMYADREGNIFYAYYGAVPVRDTQFDWSEPVNGNDPATEWQGYHPLTDLPTLTNPPSGYLQNCNATPFLATGGDGNLNAEDYPVYMVAEADNNRSRMSRILLGGQDKLSFKTFARHTWDTRVIEADTMIPQLTVELTARDLGPEDRSRAAQALTLLTRWNRISTVNSRAMTLYFFWRYHMRQLEEADLVNAFIKTLDYMETTYGTWQVRWGEVNRIQRAHTGGRDGFDDDARSLPVAGGPGNPLGLIFNFYARPTPGNQKMYGVAGHSYVSIVEFGDPVQAQSILTFGSSADPDSPHYFDQAELFANKRYKPAWFAPSQVAKNSQSIVELDF